MAFTGKLILLALFPGALFLVVGGTVAGSALSGMRGMITGACDRGPAMGIRDMAALLTGECIPTGGALHAVCWLAPAVRLLALSWISCIVFGLYEGDLALVYSLLVLAGAADLALCFFSISPRVRQNVWVEAVSLMGWAVPLALVMVTVLIRTDQASVGGVVEWQSKYGVLLGSAEGGAAAVVGTALAFAAVLLCCQVMVRLRPFSQGYFSDPPAGLAAEISGPPAAFLVAARGGALVVVPLLLIALFLAGPAGSPLQVLFWVLKVVGLVLLLGIADAVAPRARSDRVLLWCLIVGGAMAALGLVLVWLGVSP